MKPDTVKIIQIIPRESHVLGLGDDSLVYLWLVDTCTWQVWDGNL